MRIVVGIVIIVLLLMSAGCAGLGTDAETTNTSVGDDSDLETVVGTDDTSDDTPDVPDENPYEKETLVVAYNDSAVEMEKRHIVEEALEYWEDHSEEYADYPIEYDLYPSHTNPDKHIEFVESIDRCGAEIDSVAIGCADFITDIAPETAEIQVEGGYTNATLLNVTKHEIGHTLGLDHDDEPQSIMAAEQKYTINRNVTVHAQVSSSYNQAEVLDYIETALDTWAAHLQAKGHEVEHTINVVDEFNGSADIAYWATDADSTCDSELVCASDETDAGEIKISTGWIWEEDHEGVMGTYYGWYQYLESEDAPEAYRPEDDDI